MKYKEFLEAIKADVNAGYNLYKCTFGDEILKLTFTNEISAVMLVNQLHFLFTKAYEKGWRKYYMTIHVNVREYIISVFLREILAQADSYPRIIDVTEI